MKSFIFFMIITPYFASAATEPAPLDLRQVLKQGLNFSLEIKKAQAERKAADADYRIAESKLYPKLDLNASGGTQKASASMVGLSTSSTHVSEVYKARIDLEQALYSGGVITAGLSAAKLNKDVAAQKEFATRQEYSYKLVDTFLNTAQDQLLLNIAKDNRAVLKSYLDVTTRYAAIGRSKNIDKLQALANFNMSEAQVLEAESNLEKSREDLIRLLGSGDLRSLTVDTNMSVHPIETGNLDQLLQKALEENPEIRSLELQVNSLKYQNRVKMAEHRPKLSLKGSWGYDSPDRVNWVKEQSEAYSLSLNLTVPLFSGFSSFADSDKYSQQLVQLEKDLAIQRQDLQKSLAQALATIQREFERLKLTQLSATSSRKAMDVAVRDYRNGLLSSTDVLSIQRTRFDAERQYILAQHSYNSQVLSLRRDLGIDLEKLYANEP